MLPALPRLCGLVGLIRIPFSSFPGRAATILVATNGAVYVCACLRDRAFAGPIFGNHTKKPPFSQSKLLQGVVERAAGLLRTSPSLAEGMQVVKYAAGEHYHAHADYHTGTPGTEGYNRAPGFYKDPSVRRSTTCPATYYVHFGFCKSQVRAWSAGEPLCVCAGVPKR